MPKHTCPSERLHILAKRLEGFSRIRGTTDISTEELRKSARVVDRWGPVIAYVIAEIPMRSYLTLTFPPEYLQTADPFGKANTRVNHFIEDLRNKSAENIAYIGAWDINEDGHLHIHLALSCKITQAELKGMWPKGWNSKAMPIKPYPDKDGYDWSPINLARYMLRNHPTTAHCIRETSGRQEPILIKKPAFMFNDLLDGLSRKKKKELWQYFIRSLTESLKKARGKERKELAAWLREVERETGWKIRETLEIHDNLLEYFREFREYRGEEVTAPLVWLHGRER